MLIDWPSLRFTFRIASCSLAISSGSSLPGETRGRMPASAMILSAASAPMPSNDDERNCRKVRASLASSISCKPSREIRWAADVPP